MVVGGFDGSGASVATVEVFDLETATWSTGPDLPIAVNHPMAAGFDGEVAVAGGYVGPGLANPTDRAFALRDGAWEELPPMPAPRGAGGAAVVDGRLYVAGGVGPAGPATEVLFLDPANGRWSTIVGPPTGREHLGVAGLDGELLVVGGRTGGIGSNLDAAEALDVAEGSWRELPPMPTARGGSAAAATSNGFVVSAGGEADATFDEVEAHAPRRARGRGTVAELRNVGPDLRMRLWAAAGWSKVPVRSPWDLARSRTRSRRFRDRSGRVRWSRRARRLVTASLRGRPPPRTSAPRRAPRMRSAWTPAALRSRRRVRRSSIGVLTSSSARRTPDETPSRTGPCRSLACGPGPATRSPTRPLRVRPLGSPSVRRRRPAGGQRTS